VQYGNITEVYEYDRDIKRRHPSTFKAWEVYSGRKADRSKRLLSGAEKRKKLQKIQQKNAPIKSRTDGSIKRTKDSFFRLCHHNNINSTSIHFMTVTFAHELTYKKASTYFRRFMDKVQALSAPVSIRYISVPELTKKGNYHFHVLVYDLPTFLSGEPRWYKTRKGNVFYTSERETRNLQRLFLRGYIDIVPAQFKSRGIAGYMAKYMGKSLADTKHESKRNYNCSRNIKKIRSVSSNTLDRFDDLLIPDEDLVSIQESEYPVPYLGKCRYKKITTLIS